MIQYSVLKRKIKNMIVENFSNDIVEAYAIASRASELNPEMQFHAFSKVINICEGKDRCNWDNSLKRNMLLFWAYNKIAKIKISEGNYLDAFDNWQKGCKLISKPTTRIKIGNKMLEAIDKSHLNIPDKAQRIIFTASYLRDAYAKIVDTDNADRMERIIDIASNLLNVSKLKN